MLHTDTVTVTTYNALYEVVKHVHLNPVKLLHPWFPRTAAVTRVFSPADPDGAGLHTGRSQTSPRSGLHCQNSEPK